LLLKKDAGSGDIALYNLHRKNSKNLDIVIAIGRAYLDNGMFEKAEVKLKEARSIHNKNAKVNIFDGDILVAKKEAKALGDAAGKYEQALYFDPNNCLVYFKLAAIYERISPSSSIENLEKSIGTCPDYKIAYSILGRIYAQNLHYTKAIDVFQTYFNLTDQYTIDDIEKYARSHFFSKNYEEAKVLVEKGLKINPNHFVLNRYLMYIFVETENFEDGLEQVKKFFSLRQDTNYISMDYTMHASMLKKLERYNEAIEQYNIAIKTNPEEIELYKEAIDIAKSKKDYGLAAAYYKVFMAKKVEQNKKIKPDYESEVVDIYSLAYNYYLAGANISKTPQLAGELIKNESIINNIIAENAEVNIDSLKTDILYFSKQYSLYNLRKADSVIDVLIEQTPNIYTGYRLKALTKYASNSDMKLGSAKPYYEKVVEIITAMEDMSSLEPVLLEAYNYLSVHSFYIGDKQNAIFYCNKVLEIDPENKTAKQVLDELNKK